MSSGPIDDSAAREQLSALVDGELDPAGATRACAGWRDDAGCRATWHAYHLIGDVLRSDDLASDASRDAKFLLALRSRLSDEPVVLAPAPSATVAAARAAPAARRRWGWMAPSAVAAGFVVVAGTLMVTRAPAPEPTQNLAAAVPSRPAAPTALVAAPALVATAAAVPAEAPMIVMDGRLVRDVQLDRYLAAHKQFAGSSALGVPSAFLRSATADASNR